MRQTAKQRFTVSNYKRITVHADALEAAREVLGLMESDKSNDWTEEVRALRDVLDPLPEQDVFGVTPGIEALTASDITGWADAPGEDLGAFAFGNEGAPEGYTEVEEDLSEEPQYPGIEYFGTVD